MTITAKLCQQKDSSSGPWNLRNRTANPSSSAHNQLSVKDQIAGSSQTCSQDMTLNTTPLLQEASQEKAVHLNPSLDQKSPMDIYNFDSSQRRIGIFLAFEQG